MSNNTLTDAQKANIIAVYKFMTGEDKNASIIEAFAQELYRRTGASIQVGHTPGELRVSINGDTYTITIKMQEFGVEWVRHYN